MIITNFEGTYINDSRGAPIHLKSPEHSLAAYLERILTFYLACIPACIPAFYLAYILTFYLVRSGPCTLRSEAGGGAAAEEEAAEGS